MTIMYDSLRCLFLSGSITLFANTPQLFEWPIEKIGFGALLFFIIWTYMKHILPNTHIEMERKNARIAELIEEIRHLSVLRERDQKILESLLKNVASNQNSNDSTEE